jgi:putative membrane protein
MLRGRYGRLGYGLAVAFVFATAMHTSILGALITMARHVWYPIYLARASTWQIDALDDQTMAGLLMWIPAGVLMSLIAIGLFAAWLGEAGRRVAVAERRREALAPDAER